MQRNKSSKKKMFVVRKYVMARDAREAIAIERSRAVDDVWVDDEWKKEHQGRESNAIGFGK